MNNDQNRHPQNEPGTPLPHLHVPTLDAVLNKVFSIQTRSPQMDGALGLLLDMYPPKDITTMGDLSAQVEDGEEQAEGAYDDACEICGVRCVSTGYAPYPGLCVRCTAKVQHLQTQKRPPQQKGGVEHR